MTLVPDDRLADHCVFTVPLPDGDLRWPGDGRPSCPVCLGAATRTIEIEGRNALGTAAAMVAPVSVQRVYKLSVPACDQHEDGVAITVGEKVELGFRSRRYQLRFVQAQG
jgi:hypothetical protein